MSHTLKAQPSPEYIIYNFVRKYDGGNRRADRKRAIQIDLNELGD